jgi:hypothetical protein
MWPLQMGPMKVGHPRGASLAEQKKHLKQYPYMPCLTHWHIWLCHMEVGSIQVSPLARIQSKGAVVSIKLYCAYPKRGLNHPQSASLRTSNNKQPLSALDSVDILVADCRLFPKQEPIYYQIWV